MMFGSRGRYTKAVCAISAAVDSEEIGGNTKQDHLFYNSHKCQNKIDAQTAKIAMVRLELNKALPRKQEANGYVQSQQACGGHDKSSQYHDCERVPKDISGHSV